MSDDRGFRSEPDPDNPGWQTWQLNDLSRFNNWMFPKLLVRAEGDRTARLRMFPEHRHTNLGNNIHGGTVLALIDIGLFACSRMLGIIEAGTAVTLDLSIQFIGAGKPDQPCDAVTELLKETRRLVFLRGVVEQGEGNLIAAFSGTIRKPSAPR
ncbi:PaaI family thioesterase [Novosphingobium sp.]|uniref:PaaI family thioesterase n=1 Tax=Novosphingobium sp. TaxID=1874826 RepID=UPI00286C93E5|nr:PaaI family thioesterase [Novosphingobium sp.]